MILAMPISVKRTAEIVVELPCEQAMALFTPDGERRWAEGWDPRYPDPGRREGPGAVFITEHGSHHTTWVMVDHRRESVRYARVTHGVTAGTVAVDVLRSAEQATVVHVTYDLTALTPAGETWLEAFDAHYDAEIAGWATDIAALQRPDQELTGPHR
jgi:hypothetical protein